MAIYKCKMCGAVLNMTEGRNVVFCTYCGTQQTLPVIDSDRKEQLYDRAGQFRRNNDFDKASALYEQIILEDAKDCEAYWSLVLCRFGIEYVEDPATRRRIPTINRAQYTSVYDDANYTEALKHADPERRELYEKEAAQINELQRSILAISQREEPFDVFICYKETDNYGRRTPDSVLANDLYNQLTNEGYKVFFSRITLEDKLGTAYEPYIFAALNSAKAMIVIGTRTEYFNAAWVKNEWSRYLAIIKNDPKKVLIPAYRDMDPYDLPEEFSHLQAQDMSKLGFMQDLIRGIGKIIGPAKDPRGINTNRQKANQPSYSGNITALLKRGFLALEDREWAQADRFFEQALNFDAECADAYLGKLMIDLRVTNEEALENQGHSFEDNNSFKKAVRFGDDVMKEKLCGYIESINKRNEINRLDGMYNSCIIEMSNAYNHRTFLRVANSFNKIKHYKDSAELAQECYEKAQYFEAEEIRQEKEISQANRLAKERRVKSVRTAVILTIVTAVLISAVIYPLWIYGSGNYGSLVKLFKLESFKVPEGVEQIDSMTFIQCDSLKNISLSDEIHTIEAYAFYSCTSLEEIEFPDSVTRIGTRAFCKADALRDLTFSDSITTIEAYAFADCDSLVEVELPYSIRTIGEGAFSYCDNIESITIPGSVKTIDTGAFYGCENLAIVYFSGTYSEWKELYDDIYTFKVSCSDGLY